MHRFGSALLEMVRLRGSRTARTSWRVALLTFSLCAQLYPVLAAERSFAVEAPPNWVEPAIPVLDDSGSARADNLGAVCLLTDHQIRVTKTGLERYYRGVNKVLGIVGLEKVSQLELEFEPSYERLVIHHIRIQRGGSVINALKVSEIKVV